MATTATQKALDLLSDGRVLRSRDLERHGISRTSLQRLVQRGQVERVGRGLYMLPDADVSEHQSLVEACKRVPLGVVCLLSAVFAYVGASVRAYEREQVVLERFQEMTELPPTVVPKKTFEVWKDNSPPRRLLVFA